jgi:hypothetical protein
MNYWAGHNSVADQDNIRRGAGNLINAAQSMQNEGRGSNLRIEPGAANHNSGNVDDGAAQDAGAGDEEDAARCLYFQKIGWSTCFVILGVDFLPS